MNTKHATNPPTMPSAPVSAKEQEIQPQALGDEPGLTEDALGNLPMPPEIVAPRLALLETWDESVHESGFRVPPQTAEDEAEFPEVCAEEGADEAEDERLEMQEAEEERLEHEAEEAEETVKDGAK